MSHLSLFRALAVSLVFLSSAAQAVETAFVEDPGGTLTVEQAAALEFKPFSGPLPLGNRNVPTWIRLTVLPLGADAEPRALLVDPGYLNDVQIYSPDGEGWRMQQQGNRHAYSAQQRDTLNVSLPIVPSALESTTYYLRVHSITAMVRARVVTQTENRLIDARLHTVIGLYCGLALVFLLISLMAWVNTRDLVWGASALFDLATLILVPLFMGLTAQLLLRDSAGMIPTIYAMASVFHLTAASLFYGRLASALDAPRWCERGYVFAAAVAALLLVAVLSGRLAEALSGVNLTILALAFWGALVVGFIRPADALLRWGARTLYGVLVLYTFFFVLPFFGVTPPTWMSLYPAMPTHLFSMSMTMLILGRRAWLNAQAQQALEYAAREASRRFEQEQTRHAETAGFLGMLMHEIKNPLTSIRVASEMLSSGRVSADDQQRRYQGIQNAVDGINTVLQRCLDLDRLERGALTIEKTSEDVAALTRLWVTQHPQAARLRAEIPETKIVQVDVPLYVLMLSNLVDNALKYSPPDSIVELHWRNGGERVAIEVRNAVSRAGLPDPKKLFEKYYRSPLAQRGVGTGLGLYWVHRVCQMLSGDVSYREENSTVVFTLSLPATP